MGALKPIEPGKLEPDQAGASLESNSRIPGSTPFEGWERGMNEQLPVGYTAEISWAHLRMPPFPQVALKVLQLASNENVQMRQLSELISSDPAFASEVLTISNSLLYSPRYPIRSVLQAIEVLGATHLQGLCLTVGVRAYLGKSLGHPTMRTLWRHNMACALIAQQIASAGFLDRDIAYTAGVLHGIGLLGLAVVRPKEYIHLLGTHLGNAASLLEREKALFGIDNCELGKKLIEDWRLPEDFALVISALHTERAANQPWGMAE